MGTIRLTDEQRRELAEQIVASGGLWTRRQFLIAGAGAVTVLALPLSACGSGDDDAFIGEVTARILDAEAVEGDAVAPQPAVLTTDGDGNLKVNFVVAMHEDQGLLGREQSIVLRTYGYTREDVDPANLLESADWVFSVPGPTLRFPDPVSTPSRLDLVLYNRLDHDHADGTCDPSVVIEKNRQRFAGDKFPSCYHDANITNIHYHGSHVAPGGSSDNVFVTIEPGTSFANHVEFDATQPPGTHWYHPHKHGSTSIQVGSGMAGALVIDGDFDVKQINRRAQDLVFVIQQVTGQLGDKATTSINGHQAPITVNMRPGEIQRWRFINAAVRASSFSTINLPLGFPTSPDDKARPGLYLIAWDGCPFTDEQWQQERDAPVNEPGTDTDEMAPGNRADFLVVAPRVPGTYGVQARPAAANQVENASAQASQPSPLINVVVGGDPLDWELPEALPDLDVFRTTLKPITESELTRRDRVVKFSQDGGAGTPPQFYIDGVQFDPKVVNQMVPFNAVEEWTIENSTGITHPFHIHINPFQVVATSMPNDPRVGRWQDTIALPTGTPSTPGWVKIRSRFTNFSGKYVLHCHILGHEDRGMMQAVEVVATP